MKVTFNHMLAMVLVISGILKVITGDMSYYGVKASGGVVHFFGIICLFFGGLLLFSHLKNH